MYISIYVYIYVYLVHISLYMCAPRSLFSVPPAYLQAPSLPPILIPRQASFFL